MDFNPYFIRKCNEGLLREVSTHRFEKRLREERGPRGLELVVLSRTATLPLLRDLERTH